MYVKFGTREQNVFYIQIYIDSYVRVSLGGHNLGIFYARKLKFGMLLTPVLSLLRLYARVALGHTLVWRLEIKMYYMKIYTDIYVCVPTGDQNLGTFYARKLKGTPVLNLQLCTTQSCPGLCLGVELGVKMYHRS